VAEVRFAFAEMRRRPQRFVTAVVILTLIAVLLIFLGGLLDGLTAGSTNAFTAQRGELIVFSADARDSLERSRLTAEDRERVGAVDGVAEVGGLSVTLLGARRPGAVAGDRDLLDVAVFGYEVAPRGVPEPPGPGEAWADDRLETEGVAVGDTLAVGPARTPVTITGFVTDTTYLGQASLWASPSTARAVTAANRPDLEVSDDAVAALIVRLDDADADVATVAARIDASTGDATRARTLAEAADAVPGVAQQRSTFNQIIGVTVVVALVVVALFFALIVVERTALYGVLKAMGARPRALVGGVLAQAAAVSATAAAIGTALAIGLAAALPPGSVPFALSANRVVASVVLVILAALVGCLTSLRRVLRIDPASAIGSSS
jgi:putative ABC transport system permease protein